MSLMDRNLSFEMLIITVVCIASGMAYTVTAQKRQHLKVDNNEENITSVPLDNNATDQGNRILDAPWCTRPDVLNHGRIDAEGTVVSKRENAADEVLYAPGSRLRLSCTDGYSLAMDRSYILPSSKEAVVVCTFEKKTRFGALWTLVGNGDDEEEEAISSLVPTCLIESRFRGAKTDCGDLQVAENVKIRTFGWNQNGWNPFGTILVLSCPVGHILVPSGTEKRRCVNKQWTHLEKGIPRCQRLHGCGQPTELPTSITYRLNGDNCPLVRGSKTECHMNNGKFRVGVQLHLQCADASEYIGGPRIITCQQSVIDPNIAHWTPKPSYSQCLRKKSCSRPPVIPNGAWVKIKTEAIGNSEIENNTEKEEEEKSVIMKEKSYDLYAPGTQLELDCSKNFRLAGGPYRLICHPDGQWNYNHIYCFAEKMDKRLGLTILGLCFVGSLILFIIAVLLVYRQRRDTNSRQLSINVNHPHNHNAHKKRLLGRSESGSENATAQLLLV